MSITDPMTREVQHGWRLTMRRSFAALVLVSMTATLGGGVRAQESARGPASDSNPTPAAPVTTPAGFVIGPEDVLSVVFWRDKEMSSQVVVRPDGKISLPLLDEMQAAGLTPAELRQRVVEESKRFFENPNVTVVVTAINSRKVFITGQVVKPGAYVIAAPTTVLQLIAAAGGLKDFADSSNIMILRQESGRTLNYPFNYKDIRRNLRQNIELRPGDTVVVP